MAEQQPPRRPSWKDAASAGSPQVPASGHRAWQAPQTGPVADSARANRRTKLILGGTALAVLTIILIWVILWLIPPRGAALVLLGASYDENLQFAPNLQGWNGLATLQALATEDHRGALKMQVGPEALKLDPTRWKENWSDISSNTVVIFLALHGSADAEGPFLFLDDPNGKTKLRISEVLDHLITDKKLAKKNKLLILDATQVGADYRDGFVLNEFAPRLKELVEKRGDLGRNTFILCASDTNQRSWVSEEWQQTIFTHYIVEGLKGAADGNNDTRVTIGELEHYVRAQVPQWVRATRDAIQEPIFLGNEDEAGRVDLVKLREPYKPSEVPVDTLKAPDILAQWQEYQSLRAQVPSPAVYTPQVWRRYTDTLLRLEDVRRAGMGEESERKLLSRLGELKDAMQQTRRGQWRAITNSLPMPSAYGLSAPWQTRDFLVRARQVWDTPLDDKWPEKWAAVHKWAEEQPGDHDLNRRLFDLNLAGFLVNEVLALNSVTKQDLDKARKVLEESEREGNLLPVEAHFLSLLQRDFPPTPPPTELIKLALEVRVLSEQAALGGEGSNGGGAARPLYSEVIFPWIQEMVNRADRNRQVGENLLISTERTAWDESRKKFTSARDLYRDAEKDAQVVREALYRRDEVFSRLPYYANWLANQRVQGGQESKALQVRLDLTRDAWKEAHELDVLLAKGTQDVTSEEGRKTRLGELKAQTRKAMDAFSPVAQAFRDDDRNLDPTVNLQSVFHQIESALVVPELDPERRLTLIRAARGMARAFNSRDLGKTTNQPSKDQATQEAQALARRQARMALALFGTEQLVDAPALPELIKQASWTAAGEELGKQWGRLIDQSLSNLEDSRARRDLREASRLAFKSERLARLLDGAAAARFDLKRQGPGEVARDLRLHDLLGWEIARTGTDHWFAYSPDAIKPYYMLAGEALVTDAMVLASVPGTTTPDLDTERQRSVKQAREKWLDNSAVLVDAGETVRTVTTERRQVIDWKLKAKGNLPEGQPVVWLETSGAARPENAQAGDHRPCSGEGFPFLERTPVLLDLKPQQQSSKVTLHGRYRGQILDTTVTLSSTASPELIVRRFPEPDSAGMAFRADQGVQVGAIAIVLDASRSMEGRPYREATDTLESVLNSLPNGVSVSLWYFGDTWDGQNGVTGRGRVGDPVKNWDPTNTTPFKRLMSDARDLKQRGRSPIAQTMVEALGSLKKEKGFRMMLVLTDGDDNEPADPNEPISKYLEKNFAGSGVYVSMVLVGSSDTEESSARKQFAGVANGGIFTVSGSVKLAQSLREVLTPKVALLGADGKKVADIGVTVEGYGDLRWPNQHVPSGSYKADLYGIPLASNIFLDRGDRLLTEVREGSSGSLTLERMLFGLYEKNRNRSASNRTTETKEVDNWIASVLQNRYDRTISAVQTLVTLEDRRNRSPSSGHPLGQIYPAFRWIEMRPQTDQPPKTPPSLRWWNDDRFPAPAATVVAENWPRRGTDEAVANTVDVWWLDEQKGTAFPSFHTSDKTVVLKLNESTPVEVDGLRFQVEATWEEQRSVRDSAESSSTKPALVLRLRPLSEDPATLKKRIWVRAEMKSPAVGEEHSYFTNGHYTAVFWGVSAADAASFTLYLTSIEAFKKTAHYAPFRLDPARVLDRGPNPVPLR